MAFILTSLLKSHSYDENGNRVPVALDDENGILTTIKSFLPGTESLVVVANDPDDFADNDEKISVVSQSFAKTGMPFSNATVVDARNKAAAAEIITHADLILLSGGKCVCQNKFFKEINLKELLTDYVGPVIGVSAGSMNLCKTVANFPEEMSDLPDPRWLDGLGFADDIIIPHFDGETATYQFDCGDINPVRDYILPMSDKADFIGIPNGSFITVDNDGTVTYHGDVYKISKGVVTKINRYIKL